MSNDPGYKILSCPAPNQDIVDKAKSDIPSEKLQKFRESTSTLGFEKLGWGENCKILMQDGLDLDADNYVTQLIHGPCSQAKVQMEEAVIWMRNPTQIKKIKAGRGRVFIYRPVEDSLGPDNGFFKIVEGSHRMSPLEILSAEAKDIHLSPGEVIVMDGELVIEYPIEGGGLGLLKCVSKT